MLVKLDHLPKKWGKHHKTYLKPPHCHWYDMVTKIWWSSEVFFCYTRKSSGPLKNLEKQANRKSCNETYRFWKGRENLNDDNFAQRKLSGIFDWLFNSTVEKLYVQPTGRIVSHSYSDILHRCGICAIFRPCFLKSQNHLATSIIDKSLLH